MTHRLALASFLLPVTLLGVWGCSSGGGGGGPTSTFQVSSLSVTDGSVWRINREIVLQFTDPVDFSTVSSNTINIRSTDDVPATGVFKLRDPRTVVFQPNCPTREDYSDAGLLPGGVTYILRVPGIDTSPNVVRSATGVPLGVQQTRTFSTPASTSASAAFQDTRQGPPAPVVRAEGTSDPNATYMEIGGVPNDRVYFELDENQQLVLSDPDFEVPLNLYSDRATRVAVVIEFNQPVNPSATNISESRLRLEYLNSVGVWRPIATRVSLVANCTEAGARVRLEPSGILPPETSFRAVLLPGFQDLVGDPTQSTQSSFARAPTQTIDFTSLDPSDVLSDELNESYDFDSTSPLSLEDTTALFDTPQAEWGGGKLSAAFSFDGTGGPNGNFDWVVRDGEIFFFDTTTQLINGGPGGVPTATQTALNGVVDLRDLWIQEGGEIRVQGPNPIRINATGEIRIDGRLDLSGFNAKDVATLNTGNQREIGGAGSAGGGKGGTANENITGHSVRGGRGDGPFRSAGLGGEGGEMGYASGGKDNRRPGGGGGGRFSKDWPTDPEFPDRPTIADLSVAATPGTDGSPNSFGADYGAGTPMQPARGGADGVGPFLDPSDENDFFGTRPIVEAGVLVRLVRGELPSLWAGYGGGGGGNAGQRFPHPNWNFGSDEKGGGGGGAAGGLHIKALGQIVFGAVGEIRANGGRGATGENTNFLDHIGGTGGSGSGGHVILESATLVDFTDGGATVAAIPRDIVTACGQPLRTGPTQDVCSSNACNPGCVCRNWSNGGAGGAGVIQIHVPDPITAPSDSALTSDIVVPTEALTLPDPVDLITSPPAYRMIPTFGARSKVRSKWISIGGADQAPDSPSEDLVRFLFAGTQTASGPDAGKILTSNGFVQDQTPLVEDADLLGSSTARVLPDGFTLELTGAAIDAIEGGTTSGISNDIYLRTPALLRDCALRLYVVESPQRFEDFNIAGAVYDEGAPADGDEVLRITVTTERGPLTDFNPQNQTGTTGFELLPRFFKVVTAGLSNALPDTAFVRVLFQAAADNGAGAPNAASPLVDWTADISQFNLLPPGELQYFRYEIEFDLDAQAQGVGADTEPVALDFLKIPFVF